MTDLQPKLSDDEFHKNFKYFDPIVGRVEAEVMVEESSSAEAARIWVAIRYGLVEPDDDGEQPDISMVELTLEQAELLANQLNYLVEHHHWKNK